MIQYPAPSNPVPIPVPTFVLVPKVEDPNDPDVLNVALLPVFPNNPPGFCGPNKVDPLPNKPVFVPIKYIHI